MRIILSVLSVLIMVVSGSGVAQADLLVASFDSYQILRFDTASGAFLGVFATGLDGDHPLNMTIGPDGNLYVGVNNFGTPSESFIRRFDGQTGAFIDTFASGGGLLGPGRIAFGPDGNLYVTSFGGLAENSKVIRYNGNTGAYIDDFVPVGSGGLSGAEGLIFGPDGNLYVTSRVTNQILRYNGSTGAFLGVFATGGQNGPTDLTFGPDGNLYVLITMGDDSEVLRFNGLTGAFIDVFVSRFYGGDDGSNLVFGADGNLYVATGFTGNSVRRFNGTTGALIDEFVPANSGGLRYATGLLFVSPRAQIISIDIKPGGVPNSINPKSKGVIAVAILSTDTFDATSVDPSTVHFGITGTQAAPSQHSFEDVDKDGDTDMILHFRTQETGIVCGTNSALLTGKTISGEALEGTDSVQTVGCK